MADVVEDQQEYLQVQGLKSFPLSEHERSPRERSRASSIFLPAGGAYLLTAGAGPPFQTLGKARAKAVLCFPFNTDSTALCQARPPSCLRKAARALLAFCPASFSAGLGFFAPLGRKMSFRFTFWQAWDSSSCRASTAETFSSRFFLVSADSRSRPPLWSGFGPPRKAAYRTPRTQRDRFATRRARFSQGEDAAPRREGGQNDGTAYWLNAGLEAPGPYDNMEQRSFAERCLLTFGSTSGPPMLPTLYNNYKRIVQSEDTVLIHIEMVHEARIVRMNAEHDPAGIRKWLGDSIGWWEGDTLVVETINFNDMPAFCPPSQRLGAKVGKTMAPPTG